MNKYYYMEASAQTTHQVTSALALRCITRSLRLFCFLLFFLIAYNGIAQQQTDSFNLQRKGERSGYNFSVDYRIYLARENKYPAPRGFYIGPYFSYNHFTSTHYWQYKNSTANKEIGSNSNFNINTIGFEL